jgi:hypothetical protein
MKAKVIPVGRPAGRQCFRFTTKKQRDAWKALTGSESASIDKLKALAAFGVDVDYDGEESSTTPPAQNAAQESN